MSTPITVLWLLGIAFLAILWMGFLASLFQMGLGLARPWLDPSERLHRRRRVTLAALNPRWHDS